MRACWYECHGVLGAVSSLAAQLAAANGARVIGTVRRTADLPEVNDTFVSHAIALDGDDAISAIKSLAPDGVDRVIDVNFSQNIDLDAAVTRVGASSRPTPPPSRDPASPSGPCSSTTSSFAS